MDMTRINVEEIERVLDVERLMSCSNCAREELIRKGLKKIKKDLGLK